MDRIFGMRSRIEPRFFFNEKYSVVLSFPSFIDASGNFEVLFQPEKKREHRRDHLAVPAKKNVAISSYLANKKEIRSIGPLVAKLEGFPCRGPHRI